MDRLQLNPVSTGDAFIVFKLEHDRRQFLKIASGEGFRPRTTSLDRIRVKPAPEPTEIMWHNLEHDEKYMNDHRRRTNIQAIFIVITGAAINLSLKIFNSLVSWSPGQIISIVMVAVNVVGQVRLC